MCIYTWAITEVYFSSLDKVFLWGLDERELLLKAVFIDPFNNLFDQFIDILSPKPDFDLTAYSS